MTINETINNSTENQIMQTLLESGASWMNSVDKSETDKKVSIVAQEAFSKTGVITKTQRQWSESVNPRYALFNCQRTSIATVAMLETGAMDSVSVMPVAFCSTSNIEKVFPEVFNNMAKDRGCFRITSTKNDLESLMYLLGPGTHALIGASSHINSNLGHLFNYVLVEKEGVTSFEIIESYGGSHTKRAKENPEAFFAGYQQKFEVIIFYGSHQAHYTTIEKVLDAMNVEHMSRPSPSPELPESETP